MVGGEREGSVNVNGNGAPAGAVGAMHQPAPAPVVAAAAANGGSGGGGAVAGSGGGLVVEKVKFTVSVRGHQWSSARHVNETLEEFAAAIQRNARRLDFIDEDDSIVRLQLAYNDGSEPEDLDVDATLGDVIICMGDKQLVAIVNSTKPAPSAAANVSNGTTTTTTTTTTRPDSDANPSMGNASVGKRNVTAPSSYITTTTTNGPDLIALDTAHKFTFPPYKSVCRATIPKNPVSTTDPSRALKINIPPDSPSLPFQDVDRSFHPEYITGSSLPPLPRPNGKVAMCGGGAGKPAGGPSSVQQQFSSSNNHQNPTPSPAELANMLVRSSSHPHRMQCGNYGPGVSAHTNSNRSSATPPPTGGFQSFASALLSRLPMLPNQNIQCPHGATTNIALLAQFLASQLRAFVPPERTAADAAHPSPACRETKLPKDENASNGCQAAPTNNAHAEKQNHADYALFENGSPKHPEAANAKLSVSGSHEKDESSSSANVNNTMAPSSGDGVDSEHPNGRSELVFLVNRRSKTGVGTHHLKMSDLSTYFHLSVVDAAKKLGVSQTTLKKACRKFGLKRWPGRKVRSLESTIHGLEHTIAVGQGAGLEELTEAYMRSEVSKLQQEMDQLVHGTPAQHSPAVRTADLYKRLYSRGWRSKYHSPGRHDMINLNTGNHTNRTSGLTPPTARKNSKAAKENQQQQQPKGLQKLTPCKEEEEVVAPNQPPENASKESSRPNSLSGSRLGSRPNSRSGSRDVEMTDYDIEGLLPEVHNINVDESSEVPVSDVQVENGNNLCSPKTTTTTTTTTRSLENIKPSEDAGDLAVEEVAAFAERSPKRPKRECRIAAETGAVRQGLRSSTCAM